jgi:hypothetical protein
LEFIYVFPIRLVICRIIGSYRISIFLRKLLNRDFKIKSDVPTTGPCFESPVPASFGDIRIQLAKLI